MIILIILVILLLANAAGLILTGSLRFLIGAAVCAGFLAAYLYCRRSKPQEKLSALILLPPLCICGFMMLFAPIYKQSRQLWRYPFQRAFHGIYNSTPKWFPEFSGDVQSDYVFDAIPSIMQGTGHYSVRFVTSPERAAEIEKQFAAQALYTMPLAEGMLSCQSIPESAGNSYAASGEEWSGAAMFYCDEKFWYPEGKPADGTTVLCLDARGDWNHPGGSVVIVNSRTGAVEYSQFGWTQLAYGE